MKHYLLILFFFPLALFGQYNQKELVQLLSNDSEKEWVLDATYSEVIKDTNGQPQPPTFTFTKSGQLEINTFMGNAWKQTTHNYTLSNTSPYNWWINFDGKKYKMNMIQANDFHWVKLRYIDPDGLKYPSLNLELKHELK